MSLHAFVDESRRGNQYLLAAALVRSGDLAPVRTLMRGLRVPGERKIHFKSERDAIQKDIAAALVSVKVRTRVYLGQGQPDSVREGLLRSMVTDLSTAGMRRLILDSRGLERDQMDRRVIHSALSDGVVTYQHLRSHEEPVLWVADAVAWCWGAGGEWRRRIGPVVETVTDLGSVSSPRRKRRS